MDRATPTTMTLQQALKWAADRLDLYAVCHGETVECMGGHNKCWRHLDMVSSEDRFLTMVALDPYDPYTVNNNYWTDLSVADRAAAGKSNEWKDGTIDPRDPRARSAA